jgi:uncharacterized protein YndB with AHSA1/START domain
MRIYTGLLAALLMGSAVPASAEVTQKSEAGFVSRTTAEVAASPADAWKALVNPSLWWNPQHTFSGDATNLTLEPIANGCFCEKLPVAKDAPAGQKAGSVLHMRVVYAEPYRALRMVGGLGPLQSEAVNGTMTVTFRPVEGSGGKVTRILWEYVVGGYMRYKADTISGAVNKVLEGQLGGLVKLLGSVEPVAASAPVIAAEAVGPEAPVAEDMPSYTPDPARDEEAAGESVKSALDKLFPKNGTNAADGR